MKVTVSMLLLITNKSLLKHSAVGKVHLKVQGQTKSSSEGRSEVSSELLQTICL